jgi:GSH-dependent disulfide-bond oxidoreductase
LAGDNYSISDIACYPWAVNWTYFKQDIEEFKHVKRWLEELSARPAVQRGMTLGKELAADNDNFSPEEAARRAKVLYNQRAMPAPN